MKPSPARFAVPVAALAVALFAAAASAQSMPDTLGKIRASGQINVGFSPDSIPFSAAEADGKPAGYSIDLCNKVIAAIGRSVGNTSLRVNWIPGTVSERLAAIKAGKLDLECANTSATLSRMENVDFSNLSFVDSGGFLVRADGPIQGVADMMGKKIAVIGGTTTEQRLVAMLKERKVEAGVVRVRDAAEGAQLLESKQADAFAGDKIKLIGIAVTAKDPKVFSLLVADFSIEPYAFALPRGDSALRLVINRELTRVYVSGEIEEIFARWLGKLGRPSGMLAAMYVLNAVPD
ncbi:MAG: amino acid ABC transporter substrate-binding protein [Burkholderiales bacterium]|nr:amino acid ABC transporter substrate-binding protein [Burkholderiales bacterium]